MRDFSAPLRSALRESRALLKRIEDIPPARDQDQKGAA